MTSFLFKMFLLLLGKKRRENWWLAAKIRGEIYTLHVGRRIDIWEITQKQIEELKRQGLWEE